MAKLPNNNVVKELIRRISELKLAEGEEYNGLFGQTGYKSVFKGAEINTYKMLLKESVCFDGDIPEAKKSDIITKAIFKSADNDKLNYGYLGEAIKGLEKEYLNIKKQQFILITGVSITGIKTKHIVHTSNSLITISKYFPKK